MRVERLLYMAAAEKADAGVATAAAASTTAPGPAASDNIIRPSINQYR